MNRAAAASRSAQLALRSRSLVGPARLRVVRNYATDAGETSAPRRRAILPRLFLYTTLVTGSFYGVSTMIALNNDRYQDFFIESVPFGETIVDYFETHDLSRASRDAGLGGYAGKAIDLSSQAISTVYGAVSRTLGTVSSSRPESPSEALEKATEKAKQAVEMAKAQAQADIHKVKETGKVAKAQAKSDAQPVKDKAKSATAAVQEKAAGLSDDVKALGERAEAALKSVDVSEKTVAEGVAEAKDKLAEAVSSPKAGNVYDAPLPIGFEPPVGYTAPRTERKLTPPEDTKVEAKPLPPPLPLVAPAVSSLSASEPVIAQLAGTIDELASFLRDNPTASADAKGVIETAQIDLEQLGRRLESVKGEERTKLEKKMEEQAKEYSSLLLEQERKAREAIDEQEEGWKAEFDKERQRLVDAYRDKLTRELETQSEIINERLKEEVIAQGIELQRRWMRDVKMRVDQERGGRLARLDELARDLKSLERVTLDNSDVLDENVKVHTLWTALRALYSVLDSPTGEKTAFREQLRVLKNTPKAREDPVIAAALEAIEEDDVVADEGVESFTSLASWFTTKVAPRLRSVALVPDNAGILSHLTSSLLSPFLFRKTGLVEGDDVPAVLARVEFYLNQKDLDSAAREANQLKGWPKVLISDWLDAARRRLLVQQSLDCVQAEATLASLLVV